jgi:hypothetical protein
LSLWLAGGVIIHEAANIKDCGSHVWDRDSKLVDPYKFGSRIRTLVRPGGIRIPMGYEGILARIRCIVAWSIHDDDPVNNKIVRIARVAPEHDDLSYVDRARVLAPYYDKGPNRQYAVGRWTHAP